MRGIFPCLLSVGVRATSTRCVQFGAGGIGDEGPDVTWAVDNANLLNGAIANALERGVDAQVVTVRVPLSGRGRRARPEVYDIGRRIDEVTEGLAMHSLNQHKPVAPRSIGNPKAVLEKEIEVLRGKKKTVVLNELQFDSLFEGDDLFAPQALEVLLNGDDLFAPQAREVLQHAKDELERGAQVVIPINYLERSWSGLVLQKGRGDWLIVKFCDSSNWVVPKTLLRDIAAAFPENRMLIVAYETPDKTPKKKPETEDQILTRMKGAMVEIASMILRGSADRIRVDGSLEHTAKTVMRQVRTVLERYSADGVWGAKQLVPIGKAIEEARTKLPYPDTGKLLQTEETLATCEKVVKALQERGVGREQAVFDAGMELFKRLDYGTVGLAEQESKLVLRAARADLVASRRVWGRKEVEKKIQKILNLYLDNDSKKIQSHLKMEIDLIKMEDAPLNALMLLQGTAYGNDDLRALQRAESELTSIDARLSENGWNSNWDVVSVLSAIRARLDLLIPIASPGGILAVGASPQHPQSPAASVLARKKNPVENPARGATKEAMPDSDFGEEEFPPLFLSEGEDSDHSIDTASGNGYDGVQSPEGSISSEARNGLSRDGKRKNTAGIEGAEPAKRRGIEQLQRQEYSEMETIIARRYTPDGKLEYLVRLKDSTSSVWLSGGKLSAGVGVTAKEFRDAKTGAPDWKPKWADDFGGGEYEVDTVLARTKKKVDDGNGGEHYYYLVSWKHFASEENTWEPADFLKDVEALKQEVKDAPTWEAYLKTLPTGLLKT